jgi:WD40 repeat protein
MRQIALIERQERPLDQPLFDASSRRVLMSFDPATATATFWQMGDDSSGEWVTAPGEQASACIGPTINRELGLIAISRSRDRWFGAVLYDLRTGREVLAIPTRRTATESIAFSPDGRSVAAPDDSHQIQLYELPSGKNSGTFKGHSREVLALVFSPDGSRLFSADLTGTIIVWDTHSREEITQLRGHEEHVRRLIVSGDGKLLISGSRDGTARVWRSSTPR